jgi:beta-phosphoglucomutase-like phosphatase (HAD superfamily)
MISTQHKQAIVVYDVDGCMLKTEPCKTSQLAFHNITWERTAAGLLALAAVNNQALNGVDPACITEKAQGLAEPLAAAAMAKELATYGIRTNADELMRQRLELAKAAPDFQQIDTNPGVVEHLEFLKQHNIPVGVCTSSIRPVIDHLFKITDFDRFFPKDEQRITADDPRIMGQYKPDPAPWAIAMASIAALYGVARAGSNPIKMVLVENSLGNAIKAAQAYEQARAKVFLFGETPEKRTYFKVERSRAQISEERLVVIDDFAEITAYMKRYTS